MIKATRVAQRDQNRERTFNNKDNEREAFLINADTESALTIQYSKAAGDWHFPRHGQRTPEFKKNCLKMNSSM